MQAFPILRIFSLISNFCAGPYSCIFISSTWCILHNLYGSSIPATSLHCFELVVWFWKSPGFCFTITLSNLFNVTVLVELTQLLHKVLCFLLCPYPIIFSQVLWYSSSHCSISSFFLNFMLFVLVGGFLFSFRNEDNAFNPKFLFLSSLEWKCKLGAKLPYYIIFIAIRNKSGLSRIIGGGGGGGGIGSQIVNEGVGGKSCWQLELEGKRRDSS